MSKTRKDILQSNFDASRIDYVGAFIRLWMSFNTWYNDNSNSTSELERVLSTSGHKAVSNAYWDRLNHLNDPAHNDNFQHIVETVVNASTTSYIDANGNPVTMSIDDSGFRYRLQCNRNNIHTKFLEASNNDDILKDWCHGLLFFNTSSRKDPLFKLVYFGYKQYMVEHMYLPFNAFTDIPNELKAMNISQYGCMLFHNLNNFTNIKSKICTLNEIYDQRTISITSRARNYSSRTQVKKAFPKVGNKGMLFKWHEAKGLNIFKRELLLLYKLRCSIIHGDRDVTNDKVQIIARHAYNALDDIMSPLMR